MTIIHVMTPYTGAGTVNDPNRPLISDEYVLDNWSDITALPSEEMQPEPNLYVLEGKCSLATLAAIQADARFMVIWSADE